MKAGKGDPLKATADVVYADESDEKQTCPECGGDIQTDLRGRTIEIYCSDCGREY